MGFHIFTQDTQDDRSSARDAVAKCARRVWDARLSDSPERIKATDYSKLHIQCSDLDGDKIAAESQFFKPASEGDIPLPYPDVNDIKVSLELHGEFRKRVRENGVTRVQEQAEGLGGSILMMFEAIPRDTKKTASGRYPSLQSTTNWQKR
jgi:hypothetical protein